MFKNKETRYRHSKMFGGGKTTLTGNIILFIYILLVGAIVFGIGWVLSIPGKTEKTTLYLYAKDVAFMIIISFIPMIISANYIFKDASRNNLLIKVSLGLTYKEYISSVTFITRYVLGVGAISIFTSIGVHTHEWSSAFLFSLTIFALSFMFASLQLAFAIFSANVWVINIVLGIIFIVLVFVSLKFKPRTDFWLEFFRPKAGGYVGIIFANLIMVSCASAMYRIIMPRMNYVNWYSEKPQKPQI